MYTYRYMIIGFLQEEILDYASVFVPNLAYGRRMQYYIHIYILYN